MKTSPRRSPLTLFPTRDPSCTPTSTSVHTPPVLGSSCKRRLDQGSDSPLSVVLQVTSSSRLLLLLLWYWFSLLLRHKLKGPFESMDASKRSVLDPVSLNCFLRIRRFNSECYFSSLSFFSPVYLSQVSLTLTTHPFSVKTSLFYVSFRHYLLR